MYLYKLQNTYLGITENLTGFYTLSEDTPTGKDMCFEKICVLKPVLSPKTAPNGQDMCFKTHIFGFRIARTVLKITVTKEMKPSL